MAKDRMLQFFDDCDLVEHLTQEMSDIMTAINKAAALTVDGAPSNPERTVALRKLLEAKDSVYRAFTYRSED